MSMAAGIHDRYVLYITNDFPYGTIVLFQHTFKTSDQKEYPGSGCSTVMVGNLISPDASRAAEGGESVTSFT